MAQRRMFSPKIVASDAFLDMPTSTRELYFQLGMYADDEGFINPKKIIRMVGASDDDLKVLIGKRFVLPFENGVVVIKHWAINNLIRKDWRQETIYSEERKRLTIKENGAYTELVNNPLTECSVVKYSLVKSSTDTTQPQEEPQVEKSISLKQSFGEFQKVKLTPEEKQKLIDKFGEKNTLLLIEELDTYIASKGKKYSSHYATIQGWARRKMFEHAEKVDRLNTKGKQII